jgi:hypothetical protein
VGHLHAQHRWVVGIRTPACLIPYPTGELLASLYIYNSGARGGLLFDIEATPESGFTYVFKLARTCTLTWTDGVGTQIRAVESGDIAYCRFQQDLGFAFMSKKWTDFDFFERLSAELDKRQTLRLTVRYGYVEGPRLRWWRHEPPVKYRTLPILAEVGLLRAAWTRATNRS